MDDFVVTNQASSLLQDRVASGPAFQPVSVPAKSPAVSPEIPDYLQDTYYWAYINPRNVNLLDHDWVVRTILWQQHKRLQRSAFVEIQQGQSVLQSACVYGSFSASLAEHIGPQGSLDVYDVTQIQVTNTRLKLQAYPHATVHHGNVLQMGHKNYDVVCCYFLLHELPDKHKREAVNLFLNRLVPGGKAVFVDYHKPRWWHPLKLITSVVFDTLEPFAKGMWRNEVRDFADQPEQFHWRKESYFGGLFQKVVATRSD